MLQHQNVLLSLLFALTTFLAVWLIVRATNQNKLFSIILIAWLILQGALGYIGFYTKTDGLPPRFMLMLMPPLLSIIILFVTASGRKWIDTFDTEKTTWVHVVRVPVELSLFWLFTLQLVPQTMTFEGGNLDILSGISAPFIAIMLSHKSIKRNWAIAWNLLCLCLLFNVVAHGILSVPSPLQRTAFDQPNIAILHFPFTWLAAIVVPVVLFAHLVSLRKLLQKDNSATEQKTTAITAV